MEGRADGKAAPGAGAPGQPVSQRPLGAGELDGLLRGLGVLVFLFDAEDRFVDYRARSSSDLYVSPDQFVGRKVEEVLPAPLGAKMLAEIRGVRASGATAILAYEMATPGGVRDYEARFTPLPEGRVAALVLDVTDRARLERRVREAERLESVGRLAGGVAHDFNNLLTVILSCAEELDHRTAGGAAEDLADLRAAAERARELTQQLLAFARRQVIDPRPVELAELVRASERLLRRVAGEDVVLELRLSPGGWPVRADPAQLQQALVNLAANARDAMPRGGTLTVETRNVPAPDAGDCVLLAVQDTGAGLTPEARAHAFEPFFTTKAVGRGTGLGLAMVHGVVTQCGGQIAVTSAPGEGARFELRFPRAPDAPAPAARQEPARIPAGGSETVLVVEDDPGVRAVAVRALRGGGYHVVATGDPREAAALAGGARPPVRLLVTDVVLPGLGGREVAEAVERVAPGVKVLFVSGYTTETVAHHGVVPGGALLAKPFTRRALLERVRAVLDGPA